MHSFHQSRGRVFFEVLCVFGMATSCFIAWQQTGASALLGATAVAAIYGLVHLFDMRRTKPGEAAEPQRIEVDDEVERDGAAYEAEAVRPSADDQPPTAGTGMDEPEPVQPVASPSGGGRRSGGSRKGGGRRTGARKEAKAAKAAAPAETETASPMSAEKASVVELAPRTEAEFALTPEEEAAPTQIQPLFEPEPFARMPRPAFGRRGRI